MIRRYFILLPVLCALASHLHASPSQYYAQVYSEILGRSPSPAEWVSNEYLFQKNAISVNGISEIVGSLFQSSEFRQLNYTDSEEAYVLYRSIFLREPGTSEMQNIRDQLSRGVTASSVARNLVNSDEFNQLLDQVIKKPFAHGFRSSSPFNRVDIQGNGSGNISGTELQQKLNAAAASGSTVLLKRGALIKLNEQLVIPSGVTLATYDSGASDNIYRNRNGYAAMGRIVRARMFNQPLVKLEPGARMIGVWVDGRRSQLRKNDPVLKDLTLSAAERFQFSHNVSVLGGETANNVTEVSHCKISDSTGWTGIHALGSNGGLAVGFAKFGNNMITSYSASRDLEQQFFTDGISNAASDAVIINNDIVDSTDVGIVLFNPGMVSGQRSQVAGNSILSAGLDAWGGITMDHSVKIRDFCLGVNPNGFYNCFDTANGAIASSFDGVLIRNNEIWSSDEHHANVGISMGVHLWGLRMFGTGGQVLQNKLGTRQQPFNTGVGIVISGIKEPVVWENELNLALDQSYIACYSTKLLLDPTKTATLPDSLIQSGFVTGETWGLLRPKSNGFIFGKYNMIPANETNRAVAVESSTLKLEALGQNKVTDDWVVLHTERDFGDHTRYYVIKNRGNHQVIEGIEGSVKVSPFSGAESQFWRLEAFDGSVPGNGLRLVNRVTGQYLGHDAAGNAFAATDPSLLAVNWKFRKHETRELDLSQSNLLFVDPFGEFYQIYTESSKILEDRTVGNLNADFGISLYADDRSPTRPLGTADFNNDGKFDAAFLLADGSLFVSFQGQKGFTTGANYGNMGTKWGWDINRQVLGFVNLDGNTASDIVVVDTGGRIDVGYINSDGIAESKSLGYASDIGLFGLTASASSSYKSVGSGDFDGDGDSEILLVGSAGGLFRVDVENNALKKAVAIGNPLSKFGLGFTAASNSSTKPVGIADVNQDGSDDIVMIEPTGYLLAYIMEGGVPVSIVNLGSPQRSWNWNLSVHSYYSRPLGISSGKGWWNW